MGVACLRRRVLASRVLISCTCTVAADSEL